MVPPGQGPGLSRRKPPGPPVLSGPLAGHCPIWVLGRRCLHLNCSWAAAALPGPPQSRALRWDFAGPALPCSEPCLTCDTSACALGFPDLPGESWPGHESHLSPGAPFCFLLWVTVLVPFLAPDRD